MTKTSPINEVKNMYEESAESYDKIMDSEIKLPIYSETLSRLSKNIANLTGPIIDTSCGSGHMLEMYRSKFDQERKLVGIDISPAMVELTKEKLGGIVETHISDMRDLSILPSDSGAAIISFFAIHHLDVEGVFIALNEWRRVLRQGGRLLLAAWEGKGPIDYGDEADLLALNYPQKLIESWVNNAGYAIDRSEVETIEEMQMEALYLEATKK